MGGCARHAAGIRRRLAAALRRAQDGRVRHNVPRPARRLHWRPCIRPAASLPAHLRPSPLQRVARGFAALHVSRDGPRALADAGADVSGVGQAVSP